MIQVIVKRGLGDKKAPVIEDDRIVSEQMAIRRGVNFLNKSYYIVTGRTITVPHRAGLNMSLTVNIEESTIPISGNNHVRSLRISGNTEGIWNELEIESYEG